MIRSRPWLAAALLAAHVGTFSCDDDNHDDDFFIADDVSVVISGNAGTGFDAFFEDGDHVQSLSGSVPFTAEFRDQIEFFRAVVDKDSGGSEEICVTVTSTHRSEQSCTTDAFGRVSVTVGF